MYTPGTLLRLAREDRKISLQDASSFVKIRESALHAMETDRFDRFPAQYMQTFLPEYANFLNVSHAVLAEAFTATLPEFGYLVRSLYSRSLRGLEAQKAEREERQRHPAFAVRFRQYARANGRRVGVALVACWLLWFFVSSGASMLGTMLSSAIVPTPEDMRGTPFAELRSDSAVQETRLGEAGEGAMSLSPSSSLPTLSSIAFDEEKRRRQRLITEFGLDERIFEPVRPEAMNREAHEDNANSDDMRSNASMKVISLATLLPPVPEDVQNIFAQGFGYLLPNNDARARAEIVTPLESVSFAAAKAQLEAESRQRRHDEEDEVNNHIEPDMILKNILFNTSYNVNVSSAVPAPSVHTPARTELSLELLSGTSSAMLHNGKTSNSTGYAALDAIQQRADEVSARLALVMRTTSASKVSLLPHMREHMLVHGQATTTRENGNVEHQREKNTLSGKCIDSAEQDASGITEIESAEQYPLPSLHQTLQKQSRAAPVFSTLPASVQDVAQAYLQFLQVQAHTGGVSLQ